MSSSSSTTPTTTTTSDTSSSSKGSLFRSLLPYYYQAHQQLRYYLPYSALPFGATQITNNLFLGDINDAMNVPELKKNSITSVLTCVKALEPFYPNEGFTYLNLHLYDMSDEQIDHLFDESYNYIENCLEQNQKVLIHCMKGKSRSATILIAYLMKKNQWTYDDTLKYVKDRRDIVQPNTGFEIQLKNFEQKIFNK